MVSHHHLIKFLCVHASECVCVCVSNLSITIYTCKGQINTPDRKNPENPKQQQLDSVGTKLYQRC